MRTGPLKRLPSRVVQPHLVALLVTIPSTGRRGDVTQLLGGKLTTIATATSRRLRCRGECQSAACAGADQRVLAAGCLTQPGAEAIWRALRTKLCRPGRDAVKSRASTWSRSHRIAALLETMPGIN